jgi:protein-disulfide isomerase
VPVLGQLLEQYPTQVKVVFKQYPLRSHGFARQAARAAIAAGEQGKFWPFHDMLFENYNLLDDQKLAEIRDALKLNAEKFATDMASERTSAIIDEDIDDGQAAGVRGTPTVFVNGQLLRNKSLDGLRQAVEEALGHPK